MLATADKEQTVANPIVMKSDVGEVDSLAFSLFIGNLQDFASY